MLQHAELCVGISADRDTLHRDAALFTVCCATVHAPLWFPRSTHWRRRNVLAVRLYVGNPGGGRRQPVCYVCGGGGRRRPPPGLPTAPHFVPHPVAGHARRPPALTSAGDAHPDPRASVPMCLNQRASSPGMLQSPRTAFHPSLCSGGIACRHMLCHSLAHRRCPHGAVLFMSLRACPYI